MKWEGRIQIKRGIKGDLHKCQAAAFCLQAHQHQENFEKMISYLNQLTDLRSENELKIIHQEWNFVALLVVCDTLIKCENIRVVIERIKRMLICARITALINAF